MTRTSPFANLPPPSFPFQTRNLLSGFALHFAKHVRNEESLEGTELAEMAKQLIILQFPDTSEKPLDGRRRGALQSFPKYPPSRAPQSIFLLLRNSKLGLKRQSFGREFFVPIGKASRHPVSDFRPAALPAFEPRFFLAKSFSLSLPQPAPFSTLSV